MSLSDTRLRTLRPKEKPYQIADGGGLFIEVMPGGKRVWRLRYRLKGRQEKVTLGPYPSYSLADARIWREECKAKVDRGQSPMQQKRAAKAAEGTPDTLEAFVNLWLDEVVAKTNKNPRTVRRLVKKDIIPALGCKRLSEVSVSDVLALTDRIKARGSDSVALLTRNTLKRMFSYAIARERATFNPAAAVEARYVATPKSRDRALTPEEIGQLLRAIYTSNMRRANKLALHLLLICMVRKAGLTDATWDEFDFDMAEWIIPAKRMKKDRPHVVYLSDQAVEMFRELRNLASGSQYVLPSRNNLRMPIGKSTLNGVIRTLNPDIQHFVIHDFRRTASTHLHEAGFNSDWIEKALAHEQGGVRGIYNKAAYADRRRDILRWWADFVDAQIDDGKKVILGRFRRSG